MSLQPELRLDVPRLPPPHPGDSREELARGLLLMRASSMNLMRFQLAMERRDRAVALQTVDELVAIDKRMREFLDEMPPPSGAFAGLVGEVEQQREALVREKLTLVAGRHGPTVGRGEPEWAELPAGSGARAPARDGVAPGPGLTELPAQAEEEDEAVQPRRFPWLRLLLLALVVLALCAGAAAAFLAGSDIGRELLAHQLGLEVFRDAFGK